MCVFSQFLCVPKICMSTFMACVSGLASRGSTQPQSHHQKSHQHNHSHHLPAPIRSSHPSQTCLSSPLCCYVSFRWVLNLARFSHLSVWVAGVWSLYKQTINTNCPMKDDSFKIVNMPIDPPTHPCILSLISLSSVHPFIHPPINSFTHSSTIHSSIFDCFYYLFLTAFPSLICLSLAASEQHLWLCRI